MRIPGSILAARDDAKQDFTFLLCQKCNQRLERLPVVQRCKQFEVAISNLERHPERYEIRFFESEEAARLFIALEAESYLG